MSIKEGLAEVLNPGNTVFYNNVQVTNRDTSVAALTLFLEDRAAERPAFRAKNRGRRIMLKEEGPTPRDDQCGAWVLEALAATGLRSLRFAHEVPAVARIVANDLDPVAVQQIQRNVEHNERDLGLRSGVVNPRCGDAMAVLSEACAPGQRFDVVDLDPYGTAAPFLDGAVRAVTEGGLLMVTCTDMANLCGARPEQCHALYGAMPPRNQPYCHEMALRILLGAIEGHAIRYGRHIMPLFGFQVDFYCRVFVRVFSSHEKVASAAERLGTLYACHGCHSWTMQRRGRVQKGKIRASTAVGPPVGRDCEHCGSSHHVCGPFWADPYWDPDFVRRMREHVSTVGESRYGHAKRVLAMLDVMSAELRDVPLFYDMPGLGQAVRTSTPSMRQLHGALRRLGYRTSATHVRATGLKTDAPPSVVWDVMSLWAKHLNAKPPAEGTVAERLRERTPSDEVAQAIDFAALEREPIDLRATTDGDADGRRLRFPPNPAPHWGPKTRATGKAEGGAGDKEGASGDGADEEEAEPASKRTKHEK